MARKDTQSRLGENKPSVEQSVRFPPASATQRAGAQVQERVSTARGSRGQIAQGRAAARSSGQHAIEARGAIKSSRQ
eukprot:3112286-Pleurochrysis_carterae.AAC.1